MAAVVTERSTLDITFHVDDGTVMGTSYTWKFNDPDTDTVVGMAQVKSALGKVIQGAANQVTLTSGFFGDLSYTGNMATSSYEMYNVKIYTKEGYLIDGIDSAKIVTTTTTKNELS